MSLLRDWRLSAAAVMLAASPLTVTVAGSYSEDADSGVPFVNHAQMRAWLADGERGLWIQAGNLRWFYARFARACHGLSATNSLVFDTQGSDNIDSRSAVLVPGRGRCTLQSLVTSEGPPQDRNADVEPQPQAQ